MTDASWIDRSLYPFEPHHLQVEGGRMHYVDEGSGPPVVLVHGTPTWSFLYRDLIRSLAGRHRVIAPDLLGFGLSEKPEAADYRPAAQARRLEALIEHLGLEGIALVVHDFGGPIGLSYAVEHPRKVRALVLFNTWMWSLEGTPAEKMSRFLGGPIGRFLYKRLNFSPRVLLKAGFADKRKLGTEVHRHYLGALPRPAERHAPWVYARELTGSSDWYDALWRRRERIRETPALLVWGMRDPAFGPEYLERWRDVFARAEVRELPEAGHFVPEEAPEEAAAAVGEFLRR